MLRTLICSVLFAAPVLAIAAPDYKCQSYSFLRDGLNTDDFEHCQSLLKRCSKINGIADLSCTDQVVASNKSCAQLKRVADTINANTNAIQLEKVHDYTVIEQTFIADGQKTYFIVSKAGCLVNTTIDPKEIDSKVAKQYQHTKLMPMNMSEPSYSELSDGDRFTVKLRVTKECRACELAGYATINFDFDKQGKLMDVKLVGMKKHK